MGAIPDQGLLLLVILMRVILEFNENDIGNLDNVKNVLEPDLEKTEKLNVYIKKNSDKLSIVIESNNFTLIHGTVNSYLKLLKLIYLLIV